MKTKGGAAKSVLAGLVRTIQSSAEVEKICSLLQKGDSSVDIVRTPGSLRSFVTTAVIHRLSRPLLYVAPDVRTAEQARDDLRTLLGQESTLFLPPSLPSLMILYGRINGLMNGRVFSNVSWLETWMY